MEIAQSNFGTPKSLVCTQSTTCVIPCVMAGNATQTMPCCLLGGKTNRLDARRLTPFWCCLQHAQRKPYRHPGIFTKEIVEARQAAVWRVRSASSAQVTEVAGQFSQKMLKLCDSSDLDYIHVSTMNHSTAAVWIASDAALTSDLQQQQQCRQDAQRCLEKILPILEAMLTRVGPRQASNTLWSFAKLGLDPDAVCPGITAHLLHKVAEITKAVDAQAVANSVWAMAALQDVRQASNAEKSVTNRLCHQFMKCVGERGSATAQGVCSVLHGSFALDLKVELSTLDKRFAHLVSLVQHAPAQVVAQDVSNSLLYCYKLRYMPQPAQASALLAHFVSLFSVLGKEPDAQDMSNTALALAGLDVPHAAQELQSIASRIVNIPGVNSQELCNLAWSMALSNVLDHKGFDLILHILEVRMKNVVTTRNLSQLHLALDHLEPLSKTSNEYAAWVCVKDKLGNNVGYAPTSTAPSGSNTLHAILDLLGVRHRRHLQLSTYVVDAGLERIDDKEAPAVLVVTASERAHLINAPKR